MTELPPQRPEGALIQSAQRRLGISAAEAARRAGISPSRWRQITLGYQAVSGVATPVWGPDATVARMARAVGVPPARMEQAGRHEAARAMRSMTAACAPAGTDGPAAQPGARLTANAHLVEVVLRHALADLGPADAAALRSRVRALLRRLPPPPTGAADL